ncbi:hypothetical protein Rsub_02336 [Raphidocelis subcapitata]|uniref:Uncharacterized protein n=1 Tax=Raphidocelis subcapitata TaxID=307507 RepID=A0A2V0NPR1_9CHLO|nr:hypothetical protein Rsub_02336 [Raphidocelis subcapitata]|eukprot:GBF89618.1 hypothetical protein Rsub_02336 [Raphidocelis subcapitata]
MAVCGLHLADVVKSCDRSLSSPASKASGASSVDRAPCSSRSSSEPSDQDFHFGGLDQPAARERPPLQAAVDCRRGAAAARRDQDSPQPDRCGWQATAAAELRDMIRREMLRESEQPPPAGYLSRPKAAAAGAGALVTPQMRSIVASWMCEAAAEFGLQQETLFLAVGLLDRFQACSPTGVPRNVLQLLAVACLMVASKQDEVTHPTVDEFTDIAAAAFNRDDLLRMERLLLDQVGWRLRPPTAFTFLHLLAQALAGRAPPRAVAAAAYLAELALLDYGTLPHPPSLVAAAALAAGAAKHGGGGGGGGGGVAGEIGRLTGYTLADLEPCAAQLLHLRQCAALADEVPAYHPLAFIRDKFGRGEWLGISGDGDGAGGAGDGGAVGEGSPPNGEHAHSHALAAAPQPQPQEALLSRP